MKFSTNDLFSKYDQIRKEMRISSHLLKKSIMETFIFYAVLIHLFNHFMCNVEKWPDML